MAGGFDVNAFQNDQFQTSGAPPPPAVPPPPVLASDDSISGATRSGISRSDSWPINNWLLMRIGGQLIDPNVNIIHKGSIVVTDNQNETQDTCSFMMWGDPPVPHQEIVIAAATYAKRLFGGVIQTVKQVPMKAGQSPALWKIDCADWWYYANRKRVWAKYLTFPADVIFKDVVSRFTRGFTYNHVMAAPNITGGTEFSGTEVQGAIKRICNAIGWDAYIDAHKDFHFFDLETVKARSLLPGRYHYWGLDYTEDETQIRNRVLMECGGGKSTAQVAAGALSIPVDVVTWYPATGPNMRVVVGGQIIPYTAVGGASLTVPAGVITHVIPQDTEISLLVQVDDLESQAAIAAIEGGDSDGIYEYTPQPDHRLAEQGGIDRANAELIAFGKSIRGGSYKAFDDEARSGRVVDILLPYRGTKLRDKRFSITSVTTRVLGPKRRFEKTINFGTSDQLDIFTALRGVV